MAETKIFFASIEYLHEMIAFIRKESLDYLTSSALNKLELASEEAIVNTIQHSYSNLGGEIEISIANKSNQLVITIADQGVPFNPLQEEKNCDLSSPLEERSIGGLGLHLLRSCLDKVYYRREGSWNILQLIMYTGSDSKSPKSKSNK